MTASGPMEGDRVTLHLVGTVVTVVNEGLVRVEWDDYAEPRARPLLGVNTPGVTLTRGTVAPTPTQDPSCACGDPEDSPERHALAGGGTHNYEPKEG
jgi:hypothetical protein